MAVEYIFDTKYFAQTPETSGSSFVHKYRVIIGDKTGEVLAAGFNGLNTELDLMDPGMTINWEGDQDRFMNAIQGSTLSMTLRMDLQQVSVFEELVQQPEGSCFCLFFDDHVSNTEPFWYGHLVVEDLVFQVQDGYQIVDVTFTDGLAYLRGIEWPVVYHSSGTGFADLYRLVYEIVEYIPARAAYKDYVFNVLGLTHAKVYTTKAFPKPRHQVPGGNVEWPDNQDAFERTRVRRVTFHKPKKKVDRTRELPAPRDYFDVFSVLEDICHCYGATAAMFNGAINFGCRLDMATIVDEPIYSYTRKVNAGGTGWITTQGYSSNSDDDFDSRYHIMAGATKRRTLPIHQANLTHEEGGSDWLVANGYYLNSDISHLDYDDVFGYSMLTIGANLPGTVNGALMHMAGVRKDIWYIYWISRVGFTNYVESAGNTYPLPWYQFIASILNQTSFDVSTLYNLEIQSGENLRFQFGFNVRFKNKNANSYGDTEDFKKFHVGTTLIAKTRFTFTDTDGHEWRLHRPVTTHVLTNGEEDYIKINNVGLYIDDVSGGLVYEDRYYFRKVYGDINWVRDDDTNYTWDDLYYDIIVPHGKTNNSGDTYGATVIPLTVEYGSQTNYAPIGVKLDGDDTGSGVIFKEGNEEHLYHYMKEDLSVEMPYNTDGTLVDFEQFDYEGSIFEYYEPNCGPNPNTGQTNLDHWEDDTPVWRTGTPNVSGTPWQGTEKYTSSERWKTYPQWLQLTGLRICIGDGSESADIVTKIDGGDGYEIMDLGSSRLGSRRAYVNTHVGGVLEAQERNTDGTAWVTGDYDQKLQWRGHRAGSASNVPTTYYDSLHGYVCSSYLDLFGENRPQYDMTLIGKSSLNTLINPFTVAKTKQLRRDKSFTDYLMPLSYRWTMNTGVQGSWIQVGHTRDRDLLDFTTFVNAGNKNTGGGPVGGAPPGIDVWSGVNSTSVSIEYALSQAARYDPLALSQATTKNWDPVFAGSVNHHEMYYIVALDGTGLWENEDTSDVATGYYRRRIIYYLNKGYGEPNDAGWSRLTSLWAGAALPNNASYQDAKDKLEEFILEQVLYTNDYRWTFMIAADDQPSVTYLYDADNFDTGARHGYSLRKLRSSQQYAIEVTRSSDSTSLDIGFTAGGHLDETAILNFVGSQSTDIGYVTRIYDQTQDNGTDLYQTSTTNAPEICRAGAVYQDNGNAAMKFNGNQWLRSTNTVTPMDAADDRIYYAVVCKFTDGTAATGQFAFTSWNSNGANGNFQFVKLNSTGGNVLRIAQRYSNAALPRMETTGSVVDEQIIAVAEFGTGTNQKFASSDGVAIYDQFNQSTAGDVNNVSNYLSIGSRAHDNGNPMIGFIQECLIWGSAQDPYNVNDISDEINEYYESYQI